MRSLLRTALAGMIFGLAALCGLALAQTINQSIQLSQDARGPVGFDNVQLGSYFPGHILFVSGQRPAPVVVGATCGTTAPSVVGTDTAGVITVGTSATTSCLLTFGTAFGTAPTCILTPKSAILAALSYATTTTTLTITQTSTANNTIAYFCTSLS